jgi:hypothetical protein
VKGTTSGGSGKPDNSTNKQQHYEEEHPYTPDDLFLTGGVVVAGNIMDHRK